MALKAAVVERARRGLPIYMWRDGSVEELSGEELGAEADRLQAEAI